MLRYRTNTPTTVNITDVKHEFSQNSSGQQVVSVADNIGTTIDIQIRKVYQHNLGGKRYLGVLASTINNHKLRETIQFSTETPQLIIISFRQDFHG